MSEAVQAFSETVTDAQRLLETVVRSVSEALGDTCMISLVQGGKLRLAALHDPDPAALALLRAEMPTVYELDESQIFIAVQQGTMFVPAVDAGAPRAANAGLFARMGVHGMIGVALRVRGETLGILLVLRHREDAPAYDEFDRELVEHLATHAALAVGNSTLMQVAREERDARRFLDAILENMPAMVFVKEAGELRFTRFNRSGEQLLGVAREDLIGKNDFDFFPAAEAEFFVAKDRETLAGREVVEIPEEPIHTRTGQRWLHTRKVPVTDEHGKPQFLLGISMDITERRRAKELIEAANKELEAFSYSVAHDLRAPLRAIDGFSQALIEDYADKLDADGRRYLDRVRSGAQKMAELIDDLLLLSRITRAELVRRHVDISASARQIAGELERESHREIAIADNLTADADPKLIAIVLQNLLGNAWKFTAKQPDARIEVGRDAEGFFVRDNGAGFDMQYVDKLFGVFQRLHADSDFQGTGIGLATVRRIVERHGGRVWARGAVGQGATFWFTLEGR
jgi:PAS domain S-box-containing protein